MPDICSNCNEEVDQLYDHPYDPDKFVCWDCRIELIANFDEPEKEVSKNARHRQQKLPL